VCALPTSECSLFHASCQCQVAGTYSLCSYTLNVISVSYINHINRQTRYRSLCSEFKFQRSTKSYRRWLNGFHLGPASRSGIDYEIVSQRHDAINDFQDEVWTCCHYICRGFVIRTRLLPTVTLTAAAGMWPSLFSLVAKRCPYENERHSSRDTKEISFLLAKYGARRRASFYCHPLLTANFEEGQIIFRGSHEEVISIRRLWDELTLQYSGRSCCSGLACTVYTYRGLRGGFECHL
jgi:hypothetical protein